jgi:hypothetical protein
LSVLQEHPDFPVPTNFRDLAQVIARETPPIACEQLTRIKKEECEAQEKPGTKPGFKAFHFYAEPRFRGTI